MGESRGGAAPERRSFLAKAAVGAGLVWTAPLITSAPAAAQLSGCTLCGTNLVINGSAETGDTSGWTLANPTLTAHQYGVGAFPPATALIPDPGTQGLWFFYGGTDPLAVSTQVIELSECMGDIDLGRIDYTLFAYLGGWVAQNDNAGVSIEFFDGAGGAGSSVGTDSIGPVFAADRGSVTSLIPRSTGPTVVPATSRSVVVTLTQIRTSGTDNDAYADLIDLTLTCN